LAPTNPVTSCAHPRRLQGPPRCGCTRSDEGACTAEAKQEAQATVLRLTGELADLAQQAVADAAAVLANPLWAYDVTFRSW
jgi:hypothetical protein